VEQLLALAKLEAGAASTQFEPVDLAEVADDVVKELAPVIQRRGVELGFTQQHGRVLVQGYAPALVALLRNLLENSLRYVPAGGHIQL
ncbi:two-component sensor histidine kinase, partial [Salmonella enterica subsp. enterica serovar Saintpaul]|nr:two-component sensor histidine kinase [Salmonella enterica subsp. enterica serovar Saintpaul]